MASLAATTKSHSCHVQVNRIKLDADDPDDTQGLPDSISLKLRLSGEECPEDIEERISDRITEITGFCHKGFEIECLSRSSDEVR